MIIQRDKENEVNTKTEIKPAGVKLKIIQNHFLPRERGHKKTDG